jgi:hypothetical protein
MLLRFAYLAFRAILRLGRHDATRHERVFCGLVVARGRLDAGLRISRIVANPSREYAAPC